MEARESASSTPHIDVATAVTSPIRFKQPSVQEHNVVVLGRRMAPETKLNSIVQNNEAVSPSVNVASKSAANLRGNWMSKQAGNREEPLVDATCEMSCDNPPRS